MKLQKTSSLGDQLRNNFATIFISITCLIGVTVAALKPPSDEIQRFVRQLDGERAKYEIKVAEDNKLLLNNQTELKETQQQLLNVEKALSDNEDALRQTQLSLAGVMTPKKTDAQIRDEAIAALKENNAQLKKDLKNIKKAYGETITKLRSDKETYRITSQGLVKERQALEDVSNSLRVLTGKISVERAEALAKQGQNYISSIENTVEAARSDSLADLDDQQSLEIEKAFASDDSVEIQDALQTETRRLERAQEEIRDIEAAIRKCGDETVYLQQAILARQLEIRKFREKK